MGITRFLVKLDEVCGENAITNLTKISLCKTWGYGASYLACWHD